MIVGDAAMHPAELMNPRGNINPRFESETRGIDWLWRIQEHFDRTVWLNPDPPKDWDYTRTTRVIKQMFPMFPVEPGWHPGRCDHAGWRKAVRPERSPPLSPRRTSPARCRVWEIPDSAGRSRIPGPRPIQRSNREVRMVTQGKVKGASFIRSVDIVEGLVERGLISRDALEVRLSANAVRLLEEKIEPSIWYPLDAVDELSRIIVEFEGDGRPQYMRLIGCAALDHLLQRDVFRSFIEGAMKQRGKEGQTLVGLAALVYNFGHWSFEGDDLTEFTVTMDDATPLPELARNTIAGFMESLVEHCVGARVAISSERPSADRVVFRAVPVEGGASSGGASAGPLDTV